MKKATPWIVLLLVLGGIAAWYFSAMQTTENHPSEVSLPRPETAAVEPVADFPVTQIPAQQSPPPAALPTLAESDQVLIEELAVLVGPEPLGTYFVLEQVINRIVATVDRREGTAAARRRPP